MEFAFVRNGREEADREKIRAFAEAYGLVPCGELTGANIGEAMAGNYAGERPEKAAGRPFGTAAVSSLDGRNREIFDGLRQGLAKAEIARRLGVGRTTLYLYLKKNEDAGLRTGTAGAGRAGAGKNGGSGAGAGRGVAAGAGRGVAAGTGRGVAAGTGREVAAGAGRGEIGLQANKAIYDRNRT